ncbi:MAG: hypothetical protein A4E44_01727 [Methanosaeta sp. PtaB.Bin018]|jgi:hypothetical protein|nr:hypothetical protein [Methanothrix sp.]OPX74912.1 MAG: hypothetical protein A4E44_01727 [Methanosaeta sp. PtaB.Bin018]OPY46910.1 MAG: hypothetical protein A4E46_00726 [Methanosaeta sp. PtaU1.Bin016]
MIGEIISGLYNTAPSGKNLTSSGNKRSELVGGLFLPEVDPLNLALVLAFAVGFAIQQLMELVDPMIMRFGNAAT